MNTSTVELLADNVGQQVNEKILGFTARMRKENAELESEFLAIIAGFERRLSVLEKTVAKL